MKHNLVPLTLLVLSLGHSPTCVSAGLIKRVSKAIAKTTDGMFVPDTKALVDGITTRDYYGSSSSSPITPEEVVVTGERYEGPMTIELDDYNGGGYDGDYPSGEDPPEETDVDLTCKVKDDGSVKIKLRELASKGAKTVAAGMVGAMVERCTNAAVDVAASHDTFWHWLASWFKRSLVARGKQEDKYHQLLNNDYNNMQAQLDSLNQLKADLDAIAHGPEDAVESGVQAAADRAFNVQWFFLTAYCDAYNSQAYFTNTGPLASAAYTNALDTGRMRAAFLRILDMLNYYKTHEWNVDEITNWDDEGY